MKTNCFKKSKSESDISQKPATDTSVETNPCKISEANSYADALSLIANAQASLKAVNPTMQIRRVSNVLHECCKILKKYV